jgi:hypothetical protein
MLPPEHGKWNSVFKRYSRWYARGAWKMLLANFSQAADLHDVSIDGTISRAHACAAGYQKESAEQEALSHAKAAECKQAIPLLENVSAEATLADKA